MSWKSQFHKSNHVMAALYLYSNIDFRIHIFLVAASNVSKKRVFEITVNFS